MSQMGLWGYPNSRVVSIGAPQRLTDPQGQTQWSARTEAFGKTVVTIDTVNNPLRFPGQYEDAESGIMYNNMRIYNQELARYIEIDPLGVAPSANMFSYSKNNPINKFDNHGLCSSSILGVEISRDWCVTNIEILWRTIRRNEDMRLVVDVKGDIYFDFIIACREEVDSCSCPERNRDWILYLYYSYKGAVVPWVTPESIIPSPTRAIAIIRIAMAGRKLEEFNDFADKIFDMLPVWPDDICRVHRTQPTAIKLGGSC